MEGVEYMIVKKVSDEYKNYLKEKKKKKYIILFWQIFIILGCGIIWELLASCGVINTFLFSSPSQIYSLFIKYMADGSLMKHVGISVLETVLGFVLGTMFGIIIAVILWWSQTVAKIFDPILVVLNALPKTALAPIIIVWAGAGIKGIVITAISISIVTTILSAYSYFILVDEDKIKMLKSFGASKLQVLFKLILPSNIANIVSIIKINIGLSWVGVIVGEFLVSRYGIGYLIVYGGQVFRLDLVMMGVIVLAFCAFIMYEIVNTIEKIIRRKRH